MIGVEILNETQVVAEPTPVVEATPVETAPQAPVEETVQQVQTQPVVTAQDPDYVIEEMKEEALKVYIAENGDTKFCDSCGIMIAEGTSICPSCGNPID